MIIKLMHPTPECNEIDLDLDKLSGKDIIDAEKETRQLGDSSPNPLYSSTGLAVIAGKASGKVPDDIIKLKAPDFVLITTMVSNFLYAWTLPGLIPQGTSE